MSDAFRVEVRSVDGGPTALGWSGAVTVVVDRPIEAGGRGLGFNGGQLLNLAVAGCVSNDLFREAARRGIRLDRVRVVADSDYTGSPATATPIEYEVELSGGRIARGARRARGVRGRDRRDPELAPTRRRGPAEADVTERRGAADSVRDALLVAAGPPAVTRRCLHLDLGLVGSHRAPAVDVGRRSERPRGYRLMSTTQKRLPSGSARMT